MTQDTRDTGRISCIAHISRYADPEKIQHLLEQFDTETPGCPWNRDAAETLAKPPERRGWQVMYVTAREEWKNKV